MALIPTVEIVHFQPENPRATQMFDALRAAAPAAGLAVTTSSEYQGGTSLLLLWGPGAPAREQALRRHVAAGGHVLAFDLAYWDRDRKIRVSIDAPHPQAWVMRKDWPSHRFNGDPIAAPRPRAWDPCGPIIIAGLGVKARVQYGATAVDEWEADMMRACAARWSRPILYRRKKADGPLPIWATRESQGSIESALRGASLVITWHSNVAVDAIRMGIPVICRDGAAAAVCPSTFGDTNPSPLPDRVRDRFLANLAWFQWSPSEAAALWRWAQELLA